MFWKIACLSFRVSWFQFPRSENDCATEYPRQRSTGCWVEPATRTSCKRSAMKRNLLFTAYGVTFTRHVWMRSNFKDDSDRDLSTSCCGHFAFSIPQSGTYTSLTCLHNGVQEDNMEVFKLRFHIPRFQNSVFRCLNLEGVCLPWQSLQMESCSGLKVKIYCSP